MKRLSLLSLLLLLWAIPAYSQNTAIVATIKDPSNNPYAFATGSARIVCPGNQQPTINGSPVINLSIPITGLDGNGHFTQTLLDVNTMVPATCAYVFAFTAQDGKTSFTTGQIGGVTGAGPVDLSAAINAYSVPLPVVTNPASLTGTNTWTNAQTFGGGFTLPLGQTATVNGALTANGNVTTTGQTNLCAYNFNNIIFVDALTCTTPKYTTIQAALNAVVSPGNKIVIPQGTYTISSVLTVPSFPINIECADKNTTILNYTGASGDMISPWYGSRIEHCQFRGPGSGTARALNGGAAVWTLNTAYTTANTNIAPTFTNQNGHIFAETVASCTSSNSTEPTWPTTPGATVNDNTCTWKESGFTGLEVYDNIFDNWCGTQILNIGGHVYGWKIHHNLFKNGCTNVTEAILVGITSRNNEITDNEFDNIPVNAIDINGSWNIVRGNLMNHIGGTGGVTDHTCVTVVAVTGSTDETSVTDNLIEHNICNFSASQSYKISGAPGLHADRNVFLGNTCFGPTGSGSNGDCFGIVGSGASGFVADQNIIAENIGVNAQRYCISADTAGIATISNTTIIGNNCSNSGTDDFETNATANTIFSFNHLLTSGKEVSLTSDSFMTIAGNACATGSSCNLSSQLLYNSMLIQGKTMAVNANDLNVGGSGGGAFRLGSGTTQQWASDGTNTFLDGIGTLNFRTTAGATRATLSQAGVLQVNGAAANPVAAEIVNGNTALNTASITTATCDGGKAVTATGAASTDVVDWSFNAAPTATNKYGAFLIVYPVPSTNTVTFYTCNPSATTSTPTAMTVNWSVRRP